MEKELFVRLAICVNPRKAAAAGLAEKAVRSFGVGATGLSQDEKHHREALKEKVFGEARPYTSDVQPHVLPGLGPHPEVPAEQQLQITISAEMLSKVAKKIVRGCEYWLTNGRTVEPPWEIEVFFVRAADLPDTVRQMYIALGPVHLGPGLQIRRAGANDDSGAALYEIVIWDTITFYSAILPPQASAGT